MFTYLYIFALDNLFGNIISIYNIEKMFSGLRNVILLSFRLVTMYRCGQFLQGIMYMAFLVSVVVVLSLFFFYRAQVSLFNFHEEQLS